MLLIPSYIKHLTETNRRIKHLAKQKEASLKRGQQERAIDDQSNHLDHAEQQTKRKEKSTQIPLTMTCNQSLLKNNKGLEHVFKEQPTIAYRRNKNLRNMIGGTTIENIKVVRKKKPILKSSYCKPCFSRTNNHCCK